MSKSSNMNTQNETNLFMDLSSNNKKLLKLPKQWLILMTIRIALNLFSQKSYIHPDEFFQGIFKVY
jgi:hypothetical protein